MVEANGVDTVEASEIVLAGRIVTVPRDDIQRGVVEIGSPEIALKLRNDLKAAFIAIVVGGVRGKEVTAVGETVCADGSKFRQAEAGAVIFEEVAASSRFFTVLIVFQ